MPNIVVLGAGVSGLTSALLLSKDRSNVITVVAKHMPGDYDIEYASPWAGANVLPMGSAASSRWETRTWPQLRRLATEVPEAGIHLQKGRIYRQAKDMPDPLSAGSNIDNIFSENPWWKDLMDDYRELSEDELPKGILSGCEFGSVCINTVLYLAWLVGQCRAAGVVFARGTLKHISEASALSHTSAKVDIIINSTGLMAKTLGGVMDEAMTPARGQVVVVRNVAPYMAGHSGMPGDPEDELCYMMTRASGGGTVLGGTYQKGNWESQPDPNVANRIMQHAVDLVPELTNGRGVEGLDIIRHGVGLRPYREGGVRIEKERIDGIWVVHNYGHAGWGYQGSYGCAERVVELVEETQGRPKL